MIPEVKLKKIVDWLLGYVRSNYVSNIDNNHNSFLYRVFKEDSTGNKNFFNESIELIMRDKDHPMRLETRKMFDRSRAHMPTIHINLPSESPQGDGISFDNNYEEPIFDDEGGTFILQNTRGFNAKYNVTITSSNSDEVVILYHILKALIIGKPDIFELNGLTNTKISGGDLMINDNITPGPIYMRALQLNFHYEMTAPQIVFPEDYSMINDFSWEGTYNNSETFIINALLQGEILYLYANENVVL